MNILLIISLLFCLANGSSQFEHADMSTDNRYVFDSYVYLTDLEDFPNVCSDYESEACAKAWIQEIDIIRQRNSNRMSNVNYQYNSNITKENGRLKMKFQSRSIKINRKLQDKLLKFKWKQFQSKTVRRFFQILTPTIKSKDKSISQKILKISLAIRAIYNNAQPCFGKCLGKGENEIVELFKSERNYDKLSGFWESWRNVTGRKIKNLYIDRMNLENIGAKEHGYRDAASFELEDDFEEPHFNETIVRLYNEILPLYKHLHAYVRHCLAKFYPGRFDKTEPIPAHILGNVWAQQWQNIMPILQKCQADSSSFSIQEEANEKLKDIPVRKMFRMSEKFYQSIGMYPMTKYFWERSVVEDPKDRVIDCHGSASNFANKVDYRILMCTKQDINDFTTIHHEMGHVEYYMAYRNLPLTFQGSANPGFHEAIGDTIALAVKTPEHLKRIGLISEVPRSKSFDINYLLVTALEKVAFLPFALTMDSYLWSVYNGSVPLDQLNKHWWNLRHRFQGLKAPTKRSESDFDPGAKYHLAFGRTYIRYFVSFLLQFQFYESMCDISGNSGPLHRCDFYHSKEAGEKMLEMLAKGRSQQWRETLEILTNSREISTKSIMRFFDPLYTWLKETNERLEIPVGW